MSKRSKERKRRLEAERLARDVNTQPVTGDMAARVSTIVKTESNGQTVGHVNSNDITKLPKFYHSPSCFCPSCRSGDTQVDKVPSVSYNNAGYVQPSKYIDVSGDKHHNDNDIGYRPIGHDTDKSIFRIKSADILSPCPIAKVPKVYVNTRLWNEWIALAEDYNKEWLAYLVGRYIEDSRGSRYEITKMYFPPQVGQSAHVDVDDDFSSYLPDTIGAVHSHVQMGVFFSGEDKRHSNWPVEIVVNAKGEAAVQVRQHLACGQWAKNDSELMTTGDAADSRYTAALDKAFKLGGELKSARLRSKTSAVGYRTPETNPNRVELTNPSKQESLQSTINRGSIKANPANEDEWHFKINGIPHKWDEKANNGIGAYLPVVKVGDKWLTEKEIKTTGGGNAKEPSLTLDYDDVMASVTIDEETGQIIVQGEAESDDITRMISDDDGHNSSPDATGDSRPLAKLSNCPECNGTGMVDVNGQKDTCMACGGTGDKIDGMWAGYMEGYVG